MKRGLAIAAGLALVAVLVAGGAMRGLSHDPALWHVDPTVAERTGKPNDVLAAPPQSTAAAPDLVLSPSDGGAALARLHAVALSAPRVDLVAGDPAEGFVTYVQRSAVLGFPDYVSVRRVETGLAIWSRSRFGYSDLGVNRARVEGWLAEAGLSFD
ncbi:MAG: DUF1499 domain-containing protein [Pseudomonadota bacterium]